MVAGTLYLADPKPDDAHGVAALRRFIRFLVVSQEHAGNALEAGLRVPLAHVTFGRLSGKRRKYRGPQNDLPTGFDPGTTNARATSAVFGQRWTQLWAGLDHMLFEYLSSTISGLESIRCGGRFVRQKSGRIRQHLRWIRPSVRPESDSVGVGSTQFPAPAQVPQRKNARNTAMAKPQGPYKRKARNTKSHDPWKLGKSDVQQASPPQDRFLFSPTVPRFSGVILHAGFMNSGSMGEFHQFKGIARALPK